MLINAQTDMEVVGEVANSREASAKVRELQPDVLSLDLTMPGGGSIKLIEQLQQECAKTRVVVLTMHDDPAYLRAVLAAGGAAYVIKTAVDAELLTAIRAVAQGRVFVNLPQGESKAGPVSSAAIQRRLPRKTGAIHLSEREREVLSLLAQGHTNQEIGDRLFLSVKTIETYRARVTEKLGLRTRAELVRYAHEIGVLDLERSGQASDVH